MRIVTILLICVCASLTACTSTEVTNVEYEKGKLLKSENTPKVLDRKENALSINRTAVSLAKKDIFKSTKIDLYEKIESTQLRTKGTTVTDSPFWAIIATPGALILDTLSLGTMGATAEVWTKNANEWKSLKSTLENDFIVEEKDTYSNETNAIQGANIRLLINDEPAGSIRTNANGLASYDFVSVLYNSNIAPKNLINDQGVNVTAAYENTQKTQKFGNKDIPEAYFARKFEEMMPILSKRKGRFGNCELIAKNKREFFECYYE